MKFISTITLLILFSTCSFGQQAKSKTKGSKDSTKEKKVNFVPVPYLSYNRTTEFEYGITPLLMYRLSAKDTISPKSISGGVAVRTTNGTTYGFAFNRLYLKEDKYRVAIAGGLGNYNAQLFIDNIWIPNEFYDFSTDFAVFYGGVQRRVWRDLFLGLGMLYVNTESTLEESDLTFNSSERVGVSFNLSNDLRDDVYFPRAGSLLELRVNSFPLWFSNEERSSVLEGGLNKYISLRQKKDVLAIRLSFETALGDVSFDQQVVIGAREIRGYSEGKYRGEQVYNLQAEYRWMPLEHIGFVGFGSLSKLVNSTIQEHNDFWYPALGGGLRYLVLKENNMRVGLDYAIGRKDWGIYFNIGETF